MASRIEFTDVTIPAGTLITAPVRIVPTFADGELERIQMRWPPGPSGLVGLRIGHSGQVIIPFDVRTWLITDDEAIDWDVTGYPTAAKWFIDGYNSDVFDHTIQFRWLLNETPTPGLSRPPLIPITAG